MSNVPYLTKLVLGFAALVLTGVALTLGIRATFGDFAANYELTAVFTRIGQGLDEFSDVRIRGVRIGQVDEVSLNNRGEAVVKMVIDDGIDVADTTIASIRPLSVFGPKSIDLIPGDHELTGPFLEPGHVITDTRTAAELSELIAGASRLFDAIDPEETFIIVTTLAGGLRGQGQSLGATLDASGELTAATQGSLDDIRALTANAALLADTFRDRGPTILGIANDLAVALPEIIDREEEFGRLLDATTRLSRDAADLFEQHRLGLDQIVSSALLGALRDLVEKGADGLGDFLDGLDTFFGTLAEVIFIDNGNATLSGAVEFVLPLEACILFPLIGCP